MGYSGLGLTAAEVLAEINKYLTNSTNKITDARALNLDNLDAAISSLVSPLNYPIFSWNCLVAENYQSKAGTWAIDDNVVFWIGSKLTNTAASAVNDEIAIGSFYVPEATGYTLHLLHIANTVYGKAHFLINGVDEAEIDLYAGSQTLNNISSVSLGTLTVGQKIISIKISDKNASSSGYDADLYAVVIVKTQELI